MDNVEYLAERRALQMNCRVAVETAMNEMISKLQTRGFNPNEVALALADAAEDHVMRLASELHRAC